MTNESKARELDSGSLEKVRDRHMLMSLVPQQMFGLRREEAIKFKPRYADHGDHILLKGGRERVIPILNAEQRTALDQAHQLAGAGSLIPPHRSYIEQRNIYDGECKAAGLSKMHGLRHRYAQMRFEALTGFKCPAVGGPTSRLLTPAQRALDEMARQVVSHEMGHKRIQITAVYLGR